MSTELIVNEPQAMLQPQTASHAVSLAGAILDKQITTAKAFPRSIERFKQRATSMIQHDIETARSAEYAKPVGGGVVRGPSVRLCEIAAMCWTNLHVTIEPPVVSETSVTVQAIAYDLESNYQAPGIATTSIIGKTGQRYPQHMIETTIAATASKAKRNAIRAVIPGAYIQDLLDEAKKVASNNQKPIEQRRQDMLDHFARTYKVTPEQIFAFLNRDGINDITNDDLDLMTGTLTAIKEGDSVDSFFGQAKSKSEIVKEKIAARKGDQQ